MADIVPEPAGNSPARQVAQQPPLQLPAAPPAIVNNAERDQLFEFFLHRLCVIYASAFPSPARRFIEFVLLVVAVVALMILMYVHLIFVKAPVTCMDNLIATWPRNGVLRVEIIKSAPPGYDLNQSYHKEFSAAQLVSFHSPQQHGLSSGQARNVALSRQCDPPSLADLVARHYSRNGTVYRQTDFRFPSRGANPTGATAGASSGDTLGYLFDYLVASANVSTDKALQPFRETLTELELFANLVFPREKHIIEYSLEYGFLKLSPQTRKNLKIPVELVVLDPNNHTCFGNAFSRFLLEEFLGYNDLLLASLKRLAESGDKGFVRNVVTGDQFRFVNVWMSRSSYLPSAFIMIIFTLCISMLLRYSHHQIFLFIADLLQRLEFNTTLRPPNLPVAQLLTIILGLVGMETIMSDFFTDSSTAFYVIIIIWISDQFLALLCHTSVTKRHWPRFFFLYHAGFYAYYYRFNGQYSGLALTTSWLFIQHSMVYFFHHFELPDILQRWSIRNAVDAIRQNDQQQQQQQPQTPAPLPQQTLPQPQPPSPQSEEQQQTPAPLPQQTLPQPQPPSPQSEEQQQTPAPLPQQTLPQPQPPSPQSEEQQQTPAPLPQQTLPQPQPPSPQSEEQQQTPAPLPQQTLPQPQPPSPQSEEQQQTPAPLPQQTLPQPQPPSPQSEEQQQTSAPLPQQTLPPSPQSELQQQQQQQ